MKTTLFTTAALLAVAGGLAMAKPMTQPLDDPAKADRPAAVEQDRRPDVEQRTYLGVEVRPIGEATGRELGLTPGHGLRVMQVAADSPAEAAGLMPGDVLTAVNDQRLINSEQLAVLIRGMSAEDQVTLYVMREGEAIELHATLASREVQRLRPPGLRMPEAPEGLVWPRGLELELRNGLNGQLEPGEWMVPENLFDRLVMPDRAVAPRGVDELFEQMQQRMRAHREEVRRMMQRMQLEIDGLQPLDAMPADQGQTMRSSVTISDGLHTLVLKTVDGERHLRVQDRSGEVLFDAAVPEDGQIEGLPVDVQQKVDDLLKGQRIQLRLPPAPRQRLAEPAGPVA